MAKAIQVHGGKVLVSNPETVWKPYKRQGAAAESPLLEGAGPAPHAKRNSSSGIFTQNMIEGESADCVFNEATGMLMKTCPIIMPVSWLIELEGPVAYLRRLAAHRRRVREEVIKARRDASLSSDAWGKVTNQERKAMTAHRETRYIAPRTLVMPGKPGLLGTGGTPAIRYEDVVLVQCRKCDKKLLGSGMGKIRDYLWRTTDLLDGSGVPRGKLIRLLPSELAVTFSIGESYCPSCVPGYSAKGEAIRKAVIS